MRSFKCYFLWPGVLLLFERWVVATDTPVSLVHQLIPQEHTLMGVEGRLFLSGHFLHCLIVILLYFDSLVVVCSINFFVKEELTLDCNRQVPHLFLTAWQSLHRTVCYVAVIKWGRVINLIFCCWFSEHKHSSHNVCWCCGLTFAIARWFIWRYSLLHRFNFCVLQSPKEDAF